MGTRLYPNTRRPEVLEKLAGVPAGTHALLEIWNKLERLGGYGVPADAPGFPHRGAYRVLYYLHLFQSAESKAFLEAIAEDPRDLGMLADWLEEKGHPMARDIRCIYEELGQDKMDPLEDSGYRLWSYRQTRFPDLHKLDDFLTFGWGRMDYLYIRERYGEEGAVLGSEEDPELVQDILALHGVLLPLNVVVADLEGVHWS